MRRREGSAGLLSGAIATAACANWSAHQCSAQWISPSQPDPPAARGACHTWLRERPHRADRGTWRGEGSIDRLNALVAHLTTQRPQVIIAITAPAVTALKQARLPTQIVFAFVPHPVGLGSLRASHTPPATSPGRRMEKRISGGSGWNFSSMRCRPRSVLPSSGVEDSRKISRCWKAPADSRQHAQSRFLHVRSVASAIWRPPSATLRKPERKPSSS